MMEQIRKCPECDSKNIAVDTKHAELYCIDCGVVLVEDIVDLGPEWRSYDEEQAAKRIRTGPPMSYRIHDKGLGTPITGLSTRSKRLRGMSIDTTDNITLALALVEIDRMACAMKLPDNIREETAVLYRKAMKKGLIKGRSIEELVSAMLYITCRWYKVPRTLKEIAAVSRSSLKKIRRAYIFLLRRLEIKLAPADPALYIPRFCSKLGLRDEIRERAVEILKDDKGTSVAKGWGPIGTAAAVIYIATTISGEKITEREIAKIAGTTEITIRDRCKELVGRLNIDLFSPHTRREGKILGLGSM